MPSSEKKEEPWWEEEAAEIEHTRWSRWQQYVFDKSIVNEDGSYTIPLELCIRWKRQIITSYKDLSESEKDSDRKEAKQYNALFSEAIRRGRKEALEDVKNKMTASFHKANGDYGTGWDHAIDGLLDYVSDLMKKEV